MVNNMTSNMSSPETAAFEQSEHLNTHPDVDQSEAQTRRPIDFPNLRNLARAGMAGVVLAAGAGGMTESATAQGAISEVSPSVERPVSYTKAAERKAERSLKRKLLEGKAPRIYGGKIEWEVADKKNEETGYKMELPIVEKVRDKNGKLSDRYFEVSPGFDRDSQIVVRALSPYARKVRTTDGRLDGKVSRHAIAFNKNHTPVIRQTSSGHRARTPGTPIAQSKLRSNRGYVESLSSGKRYAEQIETVQRLRGVENLQEFRSVMQNYLDQYKVRLNITPEELASWSRDYTVEHLQEKDLPAVKRFGFNLVDENSKYPKGFLAEIGMRQIDLARNISYRKTVFGGVAKTDEYKTIYAVDKSESYTVHHETAHFITNVLGMQNDTQTWTSFNIPGFQYNEGIDECENDNATCGALGKSSLLGFPTEYAKTRPEEDRAEVYRYITCSGYDELKADVRKDPILGKKITYFIDKMKQRFPFFNERYLEKINPIQTCDLER